MAKAVKKSESITLQDHLYELRGRIFWVVSWLILASLGGYLIKDHIIGFLMAPLKGESLVYLTPIGGFNFIFRVCLYFGLAVAIPVIMYQLFKFVEPLMQQKKSVIAFLFFSVLLALSGGLFAYYLTMPASLNFLLNFEVEQVQAMLTVDSYLAFVVTYVLGFAILFQIPLLLLIANSITPLPPSKLMGLQRVVIVVAFVIAAIISPTPDATNQLILAAPIIAMYELGVLLVWLQNRMHRTFKKATPAKATTPFVHPSKRPATSPALAVQFASAAPIATPATTVARQSKLAAYSNQQQTARPAAMDIAPRPRTTRAPGRVIMPRQMATANRSTSVKPLSSVGRQSVPATASRISRLASIDGMRAMPASANN